MRKLTLAMAVAALGVFAAVDAGAAPINAPVPVNAYITIGGLDWAWAAPCSPDAPSCGVIDLTYQSTQGWRIATLAEFIAAGIDVTDFQRVGGNVDFGTGNNLDEASGANLQCTGGAPQVDFAVASPWFSTAHLHADWCDAAANRWDVVDNGALSEALVVRNSVPEPASLLLLGSGLAGVARLRRRKAARKA